MRKWQRQYSECLAWGQGVCKVKLWYLTKKKKMQVFSGSKFINLNIGTTDMFSLD